MCDTKSSELIWHVKRESCITRFLAKAAHCQTDLLFVRARTRSGNGEWALSNAGWLELRRSWRKNLKIGFVQLRARSYHRTNEQTKRTSVSKKTTWKLNSSSNLFFLFSLYTKAYVRTALRKQICMFLCLAFSFFGSPRVDGRIPSSFSRFKCSSFECGLCFRVCKRSWMLSNL